MMLDCGAFLTMQPGPRLNMGLPGASGQDMPAQDIVCCFGAFCI